MAKPSIKLRAAGTKQTATVQSARYRYTAIFEPAENGGYVVTIPTLNGLTTEGDTLDDARAMAADAILGYIEALQNLHEDIPREHSGAITRNITVKLSPA